MKPRLRALFCDHLSIMRGKYLPESKIGTAGTRFCQSQYGVHYDKDLLPAPGAMLFDGLPDMELRWLASEIRPSWERDTQIVVGDLYDNAGAPLPMCGRGALKRAVADWQAMGLSPKVGIELEAFAFTRQPDGSLAPYDTPGGHVYGTGPFADPLRFNDAIWERAEAAGFDLELITSEYDTPQFEYTLKFDDALRAVDSTVLFRLLAREVAFDHGVILTFLPKPIPEKGGSGMHVNFSFADSTGRNVFDNGPKGGPDHMTDLARGCVAGLVHHHKALAGLTAPTTLSYHRLKPGTLSGHLGNWGGDHRNVTTRVSGEGGYKARLEHRMADASSNPYTAVAAVLQAARLGVANGYALPAMESGDGFESWDAAETTALTLGAAMDDLAADTTLQAAVGQMLCDNHIFMKRAEVEKTAALDGAALRDFYIWYV